LAHSWLSEESLQTPISGYPTHDLLNSVRHNFNARKTFKKAVDVVKAINNLKGHSRDSSLVNLLENSKVEMDEVVDQVLYFS
jgi:calcium/calmodulin-dependent protein kinase I